MLAALFAELVLGKRFQIVPPRPTHLSWFYMHISWRPERNINTKSLLKRLGKLLSILRLEHFGVMT